jgi:hypothetical protein
LLDHPARLLSLRIEGEASGCHPSHKIESATSGSLAIRFRAANSRPDHDPLSTFRRRLAKAVEGVFGQVLQLARETPLSRFGMVGLDGTEIHGNVCRPRGLVG